MYALHYCGHLVVDYSNPFMQEFWKKKEMKLALGGSKSKENVSQLVLYLVRVPNYEVNLSHTKAMMERVSVDRINRLVSADNWDGPPLLLR